MQKKKLQVFVSSTYTDLRKERQAAVEAILTAGHIPAGMELFGAGDQSQLQVIRRWIDASDVFLLILGGRYGTIEPESGKSYIELEYRHAAAQGKPLFAIVITDRSLDIKVREDGASVFERDNPQLLREFRALVTTKMVRFWDDPRDIKLAVLESLSEISERANLIGWVPGNESTNAGYLAEEIVRLNKENASLREQVGKLKKELDAVGEPNRSSLLVDQVNKGSDAEKAIAMGRLAETHNPDFIPLIAARLDDRNPRVRDAANSALAKFAGKHISELRALYRLSSGSAVAPLADLIIATEGADAIPDLGANIIYRGRNDLIEHFATRLREFNDSQFAASLKALLLTNADDDKRVGAAFALGVLGEYAGVEALVKLLPTVSSDWRRALATALGFLRGSASVAALSKLLSDESEDVRANAAESLGKLGDPSAQEGLLSLLQDKSDWVIREALAALNTLADQSAVNGLVAALKSENTQVRKDIVAILGRIGDPRAIAALGRCLDDPDDKVRATAVVALGQFGESAIDALIIAFEDDDSPIREVAARSLGRLASPRVLKPLLSLLRREENDRVLAAAVDGLISCRDTSVIEVLKSLVREKDFPTPREERLLKLTAKALRRRGAIEELAALQRHFGSSS